MSQTIWWQDDHPALLDQTRLPFEEVVSTAVRSSQVAEAIESLRVRGAPAIGVAAAYGVALAARLAAGRASSSPEFHDAVRRHAMARGYPTNGGEPVLGHRAHAACCCDATAARITPRLSASALLAEAQAIAAEDARACRRMGELGAT